MEVEGPRGRIHTYFFLTHPRLQRLPVPSPRKLFPLNDNNVLATAQVVNPSPATSTDLERLARTLQKS
jgi:hypothetical protein